MKYQSAILPSFLLACLCVSSVYGQNAPSPMGTFQPRDVYYPQTEELAPDEMRIISCGTAMPFQRHSQAAPCLLVELGNGDKFVFDIGTGAAENIAVAISRLRNDKSGS